MAEIEEAKHRLRGIAVPTPLETSRALSQRCEGAVFVKCENLQRTGSFKIRGAYNRLSLLDDATRSRGVVAASAGNHAQGVALAASMLGIASTVFMPEAAAIPKVEAARRYGAEIALTGDNLADAVVAAKEFAAESGAEFIPPYDHQAPFNRPRADPHPPLRPSFGDRRSGNHRPGDLRTARARRDRRRPHWGRRVDLGHRHRTQVGR